MFVQKAEYIEGETCHFCQITTDLSVLMFHLSASRFNEFISVLPACNNLIF